MMRRPAVISAQDAPNTGHEPPASTAAPAVATVAPIGFFGVLYAVRASRTLTSTERLVLLLVAGHVDRKTGIAAVGAPTLSDESDYSARTIERTIAKLCSDGRLEKLATLSRWNTNQYRITLGEAESPPTERRGVNNDPRRSDGGGSLRIPDPGSVDQPIEDRPPPRSRIGHSGSSSGDSSARSERESDTHTRELRDRERAEILQALQALPELHAIARIEVAECLAGEGRPRSVVALALAKLAKDARMAAALGDDWTPSVLARKARNYVEGERGEAGGAGVAPRAEEEPLEPLEPPRLDAVVSSLRAITEAAGGSPGRETITTTGEEVLDAPQSTQITAAPTWTPPVRRKQ